MHTFVGMKKFSVSTIYYYLDHVYEVATTGGRCEGYFRLWHDTCDCDSCNSSLLCLFRFLPSTNLVDRADNCYTSLYFYFSSFSMFIQSRILKLVVICSCCSFLFLLSTFFILLFSTLLSISCSVFSLFIQFIF